VRNLLTDAKRDRTARVFGYVAIWLPDEFLVLYVQAGEAVNAMALDDDGYRALSLAEALDRVPPEPELGEICFHEAPDEQLACMHYSQMKSRSPGRPSWTPRTPTRSSRTSARRPSMGSWRSSTVTRSTTSSCAMVSWSAPTSSTASPARPRVWRARRLFAAERRAALGVFRWPTPPALPVQAPPSLIHAYRALTRALVDHLVRAGNPGAPARRRIRA